jgi:IMP dehydrogenase
VHEYERVEALIAADVDVICVDTAHGHTQNVIDTVRKIKKSFKIDVIAGNIATADAARELIDAGADAVKVGIGPGAICTTRIISGVGVPQVSAIMDVPSGRQTGRPGHRRRRHPPVRRHHQGHRRRGLVRDDRLAVRRPQGEPRANWSSTRAGSSRSTAGMGSLGAMVKGSAERYGQSSKTESASSSRGRRRPGPYRGTLSDFVYQLVGGLRAGMGYCGARNIPELMKRPIRPRQRRLGERIAPARHSDNQGSPQLLGQPAVRRLIGRRTQRTWIDRIDRIDNKKSLGQ